MTEEIVNAEELIGEEVVFPAVAGQQQRATIRWTSVMSSIVLSRMCQLISTGVRTD
jgi:hypothetical protein